MKYKILKTLDIAGLKVFEPVVRLCYGENPKKQLREIGIYIVFPILTFAVFVAAWTFVAPRHKTKSGEVPTPEWSWMPMAESSRFIIASTRN
ncbi:MAG: nitrate/nitrite transport system permease protein [Pirellulaceae bacterium]|jgi:nitrate/nitrite transport system permease protein